MSSPTWTPGALRSEATAYAGLAWRLVEAQHIVSTLKLVDRLDEQRLLEEILEETKPQLPEACRHLDYLLFTPFRYRPYPNGSRFRRAGLTPGVWYGAEHVETSLAEMIFYRYLFYAESPETPFPKDAAQYTAVGVQLKAAVAIDLTGGRLAEDRDEWEHPTRYDACQDIENAARAMSCELIRYRSVRDPGRRAAVAVLECAAFAEVRPSRHQTWRVRLSRGGAVAACEHPGDAIAFPTDAFDADPRLAAMNWDR